MKIGPIIVFSILMILVIGFSLRMHRDGTLERSGLFFVPEHEYVERISGTFRNPLALAFYMKGIMEVAQQASKKINPLLGLFGLALKLDPKIVSAAFFGGIVLPLENEELIKSITLLEEAARLDPRQWRFPYWIGFRYLEMENYEKAAEYYQKASKLPDAPRFLRFTSVSLFSKDQNLERAIRNTEGLLESVSDDEAREWVLFRLSWLKEMQNLEEKAMRYKELTGRFPTELKELVECGLLQQIPEDKIGGGFCLMYPGDPVNGYRIESRSF